MVRLPRTSAGPGAVAVTGASAGLGRALLERLATRHDLDGLLGVDALAVPVDGVVWRSADVSDPDLAAQLVGVTTLVHLATSYDVTAPASRRGALNVGGTRRVLDAAAEIGARRVVLVTSAEVYGAGPDNPVPLPDSAPLREGEEEGSLVSEHLRVEGLAEQARRAGREVTVLRPASLVGLPAGYEGHRLRQLGGQRLLAVRGIEPRWQLCHVDDLVSALELAAVGAVTGTRGVACEGALSQALVERATGTRRLELPASVALSTAERLRRLGVSASSAHELDHLLGHLVLACDGLRAAGWVPQWTNEAALESHLRGRSSDSRSGAYTAAGATVALLGTAALVRQARRRRRL